MFENINISWNDGFLLHEESIEIKKNATPTEEELLASCFAKSTNREIFSLIHYKHIKGKYEQELRQALNMETHQRIRNFHKKYQTGQKRFDRVKMWPTKTRNKPLITSPIHILDMPSLNVNFGDHILDLGAKDFVATIFQGEIFIHHLENESTIKSRTSSTVKNCLKWDKTGSFLAFAMEKKSVAILDVEHLKTIAKNTCFCCDITSSVTTIEYTPNFVVTGCASGTLSLWTHNLELCRYIRKAHSKKIIKIVASWDFKFIATSDLNSIIRVWRMPSLDAQFEIKNVTPTSALTWHPMKQGLLVVGGLSCTLWNVNIPKRIHWTDMYFEIIDSATFNPISGELVISGFNPLSPKRSFSTPIYVMSDLRTIVDEITFHEARTPYIMWNSDGTKMVTASTDENLCVWDFFGNQTKQFYNCKTNKNRTKKSSIDYFNFLDSFGRTIR